MYKRDIISSFCELDNRLKQLEECCNNKQDKLVSGVNIKTINNLSLIGIGNINTKSKEFENYYTKNEINNILANISLGSSNIRYLIVFDSNNKDYVDLGLPSGTLWSTENLNGYYQFGKLDTIEKTKYAPPYHGDPGIIDREFDIINHKWGGDWRLPTKEQFLELIENTTPRIVSNYHGESGIIFESPNGNFIFLPNGGIYQDILRNESNGYYWTCNKEYLGASAFNQLQNGEKIISTYHVNDGLYVRGVLTPVVIDFLDLFNKEDKSNKITNLSAESTDIEYPSAKAVVNALTELDDRKLDKIEYIPGDYLSTLN